MCQKVIVTVGEVFGKDVDTWLSITAKNGTCVLTGMGNMMDNQVTLNLAMLTLLQKNLQGSIFGGATPSSTSRCCCRCTRSASSTSTT
jgi:S-(hydroxymethyl)glutathione dehydrogenase/alcohol dehydrogenase